MAGKVAVEIDSARAIAVVRLVNPQRRNAISAAMWREIRAFAETIGERTDVRAILVAGAGGVFSAGADIADFSETRADETTAQGYDDLVEFTCRAFEAVPQVTIGAIEGPCFGAGASLAASCDLRVAAAGARFAVPAARLGLGYDVRGIERFIRVFGAATSGQLLLTAEPLAAERAYALGAVHVLADAGGAETAAFAVAARVASNAPLTLRSAKLALRAIGLNDAALKERAGELAALADASADYREGRAAFAEKRTPNFRGR